MKYLIKIDDAIYLYLIKSAQYYNETDYIRLDQLNQAIIEGKYILFGLKEARYIIKLDKETFSDFFYEILHHH